MYLHVNHLHDTKRHISKEFTSNAKNNLNENNHRILYKLKYEYFERDFDFWRMASLQNTTNPRKW